MHLGSCVRDHHCPRRQFHTASYRFPYQRPGPAAVGIAIPWHQDQPALSFHAAGIVNVSQAD
jgi:hypothetical protein